MPLLHAALVAGAAASPSDAAPSLRRRRGKQPGAAARGAGGAGRTAHRRRASPRTTSGLLCAAPRPASASASASTSASASSDDDGGETVDESGAEEPQDAEQTRQLLEQLDAQDGNGLTSLHRAAASGDAARVAELVRQGAHIYKRVPSTYFTALHYALHLQHRDVVLVLLRAGATPFQEDVTPPHYPIECVRSREMAELLLEHYTSTRPNRAMRERLEAALSWISLEEDISLSQLDLHSWCDDEKDADADADSDDASAGDRGTGSLRATLCGGGSGCSDCSGVADDVASGSVSSRDSALLGGADVDTLAAFAAPGLFRSRPIF